MVRTWSTLRLFGNSSATYAKTEPTKEGAGITKHHRRAEVKWDGTKGTYERTDWGKQGELKKSSSNIIGGKQIALYNPRKVSLWQIAIAYTYHIPLVICLLSSCVPFWHPHQHTGIYPVINVADPVCLLIWRVPPKTLTGEFGWNYMFGKIEWPNQIVSTTSSGKFC